MEGSCASSMSTFLCTRALSFCLLRWSTSGCSSPLLLKERSRLWSRLRSSQRRMVTTTMFEDCENGTFLRRGREKFGVGDDALQNAIRTVTSSAVMKNLRQ